MNDAARRGRTAMWIGVAALLLLPAVAMCFTTKVAWGTEDFAAAALLLCGGGAAVELAFRVTRRPVPRGVAALTAVGVVVLIWAEAAVGVF